MIAYIQDVKDILQALDLETLIEMEHFIGCDFHDLPHHIHSRQITTEKQRDHHLRMQRRLNKKNI